jgi:hypothetical protein
MPELEPERVITVHPKDTLIFQFARPITQFEANEARERIAHSIDPRIHFLVVGSDLDITVLRPEEPETGASDQD